MSEITHGHKDDGSDRKITDADREHAKKSKERDEKTDKK